jgi:hypothetical protein
MPELGFGHEVCEQEFRKTIDLSLLVLDFSAQFLKLEFEAGGELEAFDEIRRPGEDSHHE